MAGNRGERANWVQDIVNNDSQSSVTVPKKEENNNSNFTYLIEVNNDGIYKVSQGNVKFTLDKEINPVLIEYMDNFLEEVKNYFKPKNTDQIDIYIILDKDKKISACKVGIGKNNKIKFELNDEIKNQLEQCFSSLNQKTINKQNESQIAKPNCFPVNDVNNQRLPESTNNSTRTLVPSN